MKRDGGARCRDSIHRGFIYSATQESEFGADAVEVSGFQQARATFKVAAFPGEGGAMKAAWLAELNATLGTDRAQHLLQMSANWIRSDLGDFGEAERTLTIREGAGSGGYADKSTKGHQSSMGTGGPAPIPPGWRHLIERPADGGLPLLR